MDTSNNGMRRPHVVVIGAGFGGLEAGKKLRKKAVDVTVVDQHNFHTFQPLLYQVATAGLEPGDIAHAVRDTFAGSPNVDFRLGTVTNVNWETETVELADGGRLPYDYLVLAAGATTADYGVEGVREYAYGMKSLSDAVRLRNHILHQFERANQNPELIDEGALTFAIVGGGPTGVEIAGALIELFENVLMDDYPNLDVTKARVILIEAADGLLLSYDKSLQDYTAKTLRKRGVDVRLNTQVTSVNEDRVVLGSGESIQSKTLIWAAGIKVTPLAARLGVEQRSGGRVEVNPDLSLSGRPNAFVVGDMVASSDDDEHLHPQVAQLAIQGGRHASKQILRDLNGQPREDFRYKDLGQMATIGRNAGVLQLPNGFKLKGWIAWMGWLVVHLVKLVGFQNRFSVLMNWVWNYFTYDRAARLIFAGSVPFSRRQAEEQPVNVDEAARELAPLV
ncbi:MAG: NAD(P)/FAD-dependent oxidoreductase [Bacteroidota bacterium]